MASQSQNTPQISDADPISKFKMLVPRLKDALTNLIKVAAQVFNTNANIDSSMKVTDATQLKFDKSLEEFYAIADQIELNLRLALECQLQNADSARYTPLPVHTPTPKQETSQLQQPQTQEGPTYVQYLNIVGKQVTCAKEIHDALLECSKKIGEKSTPSGAYGGAGQAHSQPVSSSAVTMSNTPTT